MNPLASLDLAKKLGPLPRGVWLLGIGGGLGLALLLKNRNSPPVDGEDAAVAGEDTDGSYFSLGASEGSAPVGSNQSASGPTSGVDVPLGNLPTYPEVPPADPGALAPYYIDQRSLNVFQLPKAAALKPPAPAAKARTQAQINKGMSTAHKRAVNARMAAEKKAKSAVKNKSNGRAPARPAPAAHKAAPKAKKPAAAHAPRSHAPVKKPAVHKPAPARKPAPKKPAPKKRR